VFGMTDSCAGTHDLDVASNRSADLARTVLVRHRALADIGDDFHVSMEMTAEAGSGRDLVVVPDHEGAERTILGITVGRNNEVMTRL
jgi:hypothetical protein